MPLKATRLKERKPVGLFGKMETDPVCKMKVDPKTAKITYAWQGKTYYFCSPGCKAKFEATPERFVSGASATM